METSSMNRRQVLSIFGTGVVGAAGLWFAYQVEQGNIDIGDEAAVSGTVHRTAESFSFEATRNDEIFISLEVESEEGHSGGFSLSAPDGTQVLSKSIRTSVDTHEQHTAQQDGTYSLSVNPGDARLRVGVSVTEG